MFSPIHTMFYYFPMRAYTTVLILCAISLYTYAYVQRRQESQTLSGARGAAIWLLVTYMLLLVFFTVLGRRSQDYYRYNFNIGYSYRDAFFNGTPTTIQQIGVNIAIFVPVGFLGTLAAKRHGFLKGLLIGLALTAGIEAMQLALRNGTCEIDDLISNTLGTLCGCTLGKGVPAALDRIKKKPPQEKEESSMKNVYITALTNERYLPGAMALARSLREVGAKYPLAVMIPEEKSSSLGQAVRDYGILDLPNVFLLPKENIALSDNTGLTAVVESKYDYWRDSFFKLQAAGCTEFDKIILLDCDQMTVKNIDHLFDCPPMTSTTCGRCVHEDWRGLSSGLLVLEPSAQMHEKLLSFILPAIEFKASRGQQAGDQDVFQLSFPEWRDRSDLYIPETYNICWAWISDLCKKEHCTPKDFYMIHFPGKEKPWDHGRLFYLKHFLSLLRHGQTGKLLYKTFIWRKYRNLCERQEPNFTG